EAYDRTRRTRHLVFNPFTREMEAYGGAIGSLGVASGQAVASVMQAALGTITWDIAERPSGESGVAAIEFKTASRFFCGHFWIRARDVDGGVILEDAWTVAGGSDMRTAYMPMANLVLMTHPKGFAQIAEQFVEEVRRARAGDVEYVGEIGPPSVERL